MKNLLLGFMMLLAFGVFAQSTHTVDFETPGVGADWIWTVAENADNPPLEFIANPVSGGINTSATVAQFTARFEGAPWALCFTDDDGEFTFDATNSTVKIMVYKTVISDIGFKFEGPSGDIQLVEANTLINQWEEITFDFSESEGNTYSRIVIIPDFDFTPRTQENIVLFDNIQVPDGVIAPPPNEPTVAAPTPTQDPGSVISMFSDAYTDVPVDTWLTSWSQGALEDVLIAGNPTKKYSSVTFVGVETVGPNLINATSMTHFHMDVWSPDANDFKIKLVDFGADGAYGGGDDSEHELTFTAPTPETWISYDIPLTDFTGLTSTEHLAQLIMVKAPLGVFYLDNVFYYTEGVSYTTTFNPTNGSTNVPIDISPTITFSAPIQMADGSTITNGDIATIVSFKETNAGGPNVPYSGTIDAEKKIITINPSSDLSNNQEYYLALNNNFIKFQGGDLIPGENVVFTTIQAIQLDLYDNFDDPSALTWGYWDNQAGGILDVEAANPNPSPFGLNPSPIVAKYTKEEGSDAYTHTFAILGGKLDLSTNNQFQMVVYSENAGSVFALKLQNNDIPDPWTTEVTVEYTIQSINTWELATFDFSAYSDRTDLDKVLLMINPGMTGAGVHYFDEVYGPPFTPPAASPVVVDAYTTDDGSGIEVKFDKDMEPEPGNNGNFNVYVNGLMNPVVSTYRKSEDNTIIVLNLSAAVNPGDVISLSYLMSGTVTSLDHGVLQAFEDYNVTNTLATLLDLTVFLEGPFNGSNMNTTLNPSSLPLIQPYNTTPWDYEGLENVASIPNSDIVDWLLVEVRDAPSAELATSGTRVGRQAAFLLRNGDIVGIDGSSYLLFDITITDSLFVVIEHRNHLSVLSASGLVRNAGVYSYNFSTGPDKAYNGNLKEIGPNIWGMFGGNGFADDQINEQDKTSVWEVEAGAAGYFSGDFNMDGQVDNLDKNEVWLQNNGTFTDEYQLIWQDEFDVNGAPDGNN